MRNRLRIVTLTLVLLRMAILPAPRGGRAQDAGPPPQPASLILEEMRTVYLGNLARRDNGVPPLRWNAQLTEAARWLSWDSVENRPGGYCGHQDTLGRWPSDRAPLFGYKGYAGAENAFCGYVTPEAAIEGWMNSPDHRANLLDPNSREVGLGYYRRESDGRGYVTQDFGHDPVYPPLVIENEAITTTASVVDLYIYDREGGGGFAGMGPATEMMVSNDACFTGASWEPYVAEKRWSLEAGTGWRAVYVKTRDALSRTVVVSDTIYRGSDLPLNELGLHLASTTTERVTLYGLDGGGLPYMQLSQNWIADDTFPTFQLYWGNGEQVSDGDALGGTAFRLRPGAGESFAWVWTTEFIKDTPFVAYFRLKVNDNSSSEEVARISVKGGGTEYGPLSLKGTDFKAANLYQEFPIAFTFHDTPDDPYLFFNFWRSGQADLYVDAVYIFTAPQPVQNPFVWTVPGGNYRGGGVWVRYTDGGSTFSAVQEVDTTPKRLSVSPERLLFLVEQGSSPQSTYTLTVQRCGSFAWTVTGDASWLSLQTVGETVKVGVDAAGLASGTYEATITVEAEAGVVGSPARIPVTLVVADQLHDLFLPLVLRGT
ncbi:MAG TPA: CAP domain-containing protein [Chloroflexi bacterium]|nr:CAP domain-containing protein [Chloroflexota bacterium]